jgi:hypothetical protein
MISLLPIAGPVVAGQRRGAVRGAGKAKRMGHSFMNKQDEANLAYFVEFPQRCVGFDGVVAELCKK